MNLSVFSEAEGVRHVKVARFLLAKAQRISFYCEVIADYLSKAARSLSWVSGVSCYGRTIWIAGAHRDDGKRFVVHAEEKLRAFLELERVTRESLKRAGSRPENRARA